jgi:prepilin-type N-terminal cleavage/methylation domain-containing protein
MQNAIVHKFSRSPKKGFTLLEVLLAIAIFSLCMSAIYASFRTATRAYEETQRGADVHQSIRFTLNLLRDDFRAVQYEGDYDLHYALIEEAKLRQANEVTLDVDDIDGSQDDKKDSEDDTDEDRYIGSKYNLRFRVYDEGDMDVVEFTRCPSADPSNVGGVKGPVRVRYFIDRGNLYRQQGPATTVMQINPNFKEDLRLANEALERETKEGAEPRDLIGEYMARRYPPSLETRADIKYFVEEDAPMGAPELLAENVVLFDVKCGYYYSEWQETDSWDSDTHAHRTGEFSVTDSDPNYDLKLSAYKTRSSDGLPMYVRVLFGVDARTERTRKKNKEGVPRTISLESVVWLPGAIENYVESDQDAFEPTEGFEDDKGGRSQ